MTRLGQHILGESCRIANTFVLAAGAGKAETRTKGDFVNVSSEGLLVALDPKARFSCTAIFCKVDFLDGVAGALERASVRGMKRIPDFASMES